MARTELAYRKKKACLVHESRLFTFILLFTLTEAQALVLRAAEEVRESIIVEK
jgi:hypothetical protein